MISGFRGDLIFYEKYFFRNGVISGDKIMVDYGRCECGSNSPSIRDNITRYSDLPGGDKISCSGTIDAYVRGVS